MMVIVLENLDTKDKIYIDPNKPLIFGRGKISKCTDRRVSRNHLKLTCIGKEGLMVKNLYSKPIFFSISGAPPLNEIKSNEEKILCADDCFGFLKFHHWFKITSVSMSSITDQSINNKNEILDVEENYEDKTSSEGEDTDVNNLDIPPELKKTRRIPLWMYHVTTPEEIMEINKREKEAKERKEIEKKEKKEERERKYKEKNKGSKLNKTTLKVVKETTFSPKKRPSTNSPNSKEKKVKLLDQEVAFLGDLSEIKIKCEPDEIPGNSVSDNASSVSEKSQDRESISLCDKSEEKNKVCENSESELNDKPVSNALNKKNQKMDDLSDNGEASSSTCPRPICQYEENCFRKNELHKTKFSHPGDPDFVPYEKRPLCQYGAACYRKNFSHMVEYRHPSSGSSSQGTNPTYSGSPSPPSEIQMSYSSNLDSSSSSSSTSQPIISDDPVSSLPAKRKRKTNTQQNEKYLEELDEEDQEDPFANDDSSDDFVVDSQDEESD